MSALADTPSSIHATDAGAAVRALPLLALTVAVLALLALVTCLDALVLHDVPAAVGCLAFLGSTLGTAGVVQAIRRAVALSRTARGLRRAVLAASPLEGHPGVALVQTPRPGAFCIGLLRPRVFVSSGAVETLSPQALGAVIAHERHHARHRDALRDGAAEIVAAACFLRPAESRARNAYRTLRELDADRAAAPTRATRRALAAAMLELDGSGRTFEEVRVDRLLGRAVRLELPRETLVGALVLLSALALTAAACTLATGCVDIFVLREDDATADRAALLPAMLLCAALLDAALANQPFATTKRGELGPA